MSRHSRACCRGVALAALLVFGASADSAAQGADSDGIAYEVVFDGAPAERDIDSEIEELSQLNAMTGKPPATVAALRRRADDDRRRIRDYLRSKGYFAAEVEIEVDAGRTPALATVRISPGEVYQLAGVQITNKEGTGPGKELPVEFEALGIEQDMKSDAGAILAVPERLERQLEDRSFAYAKVVDRRVVVNHDDKAVFLYLTVDTGPVSAFGDTTVKGATEVQEDFIRRRIAWRKGEPFSREAIDETRKALAETGLFASVTIDRAEKPESDGAVPMTISVIDRDRRTIGGGLRYSTSDGPGARLFWTHRNLFGGGQRLDITGEAAEIRKGGSVEYREPDLFLSTSNTGILTASYLDESPDGFDSEETRISGVLEHTFDPHYKGSSGLALERDLVEDEGRDQIFTLVSTPLQLQRDTSNDLLNPTDGGRTRLTLTPYLGAIGSDVTFAVAEIHDAAYFPLDDKGLYSIATWWKIASLWGETTAGVPANKRIYAGGPGSVRAYSENRVGPLDAQGEPAGGRSSTEAGVEARIRVYGDFAVVPFIETGAVYDENTPEFGQDLQWGGGIGLRYHTPIGPVRLDVAFPFDPRPQDDSFQVLISLGQAF